jgi:hypothetical protein
MKVGINISQIHTGLHICTLICVRLFKVGRAIDLDHITINHIVRNRTHEWPSKIIRFVVFEWIVLVPSKRRYSPVKDRLLTNYMFIACILIYTPRLFVMQEEKHCWLSIRENWNASYTWSSDDKYVYHDVTPQIELRPARTVLTWVE